MNNQRRSTYPSREPVQTNRPTSEISIEFIDFITAKRFVTVVEDWFEHLTRMPRPRMTNFILKHSPSISLVGTQVEKLGVAGYIAGICWFKRGIEVSISQLLVIMATALVLWALIAIAMRLIIRRNNRRTSRNILPSVILLTQGDEKAYQKVKANLVSSRFAFVQLVASSVGAIVLNVVASYLYTYLTTS